MSVKTKEGIDAPKPKAVKAKKVTKKVVKKVAKKVTEKVAKVAPKQPVDLRVCWEDIAERKEKALSSAQHNVVGKLSKGGNMDFRVLNRTINDKLAHVVAMAASRPHLHTDDGVVSASVECTGACADRHGVVVRYAVTSHDNVNNRFVTTTHIEAIPMDKNVAHLSGYCSERLTVDSLISRINDELYSTLDNTFNKVLFEAGLAPEPFTRYREDD